MGKRMDRDDSHSQRYFKGRSSISHPSLHSIIIVIFFFVLYKSNWSSLSSGHLLSASSGSLSKTPRLIVARPLTHSHSPGVSAFDLSRESAEDRDSYRERIEVEEMILVTILAELMEEYMAVLARALEHVFLGFPFPRRVRFLILCNLPFATSPPPPPYPIPLPSAYSPSSGVH
ncbi:hypothetical protein SAY87_024849 [Trapa incisa]|uniref:Uncharacterized protein n=1 Tax=Trapa incisa TaxID=236973 RepID=A0AAN7J8Z2_9MYRT|nr:hypothetical protein SAY87_024849 [Trapa incisa]